MRCEESRIVDGNPTWDDASPMDWREVDRALREIARRRAKLDAEEAQWLREAERLQIWRPLGMVSALDYLERVLGHTPHVANERLRVARALGELPALTEAFASGELSFSAIRELTRVATPATETRWRDAAVGKNVRQIEELVAGHRRGDAPEDPADPEVRTHVIRFELGAEVFARLRQTRTALTEQRGRHVDDDQLVTALCDALLDRASSGTEPTGRAKFQIAVTVCERCDRGWQEGAGTKVPIDVAALERARCDAQYIGSIHRSRGTDGDAPERASQDIPPSVVRFVWHRDGGRCQTPGCRSTVGLEIHHVIHRADGGSHDPSNLRLQCSSCHMALHREALTITRNESGRLEAQRREEPCGAGSKLDATIARTQARDALVGLGWKPAVARAAVEEAWSHVGPSARVEMLIREALRRCPKPTA